MQGRTRSARGSLALPSAALISRLATGERAHSARARALRSAAVALARHVSRGRRARAIVPTSSLTTKDTPMTSLHANAPSPTRSRVKCPRTSVAGSQGVLPAAHQDVLEEPSQGADLLAARDALGELLGLALHPCLHQRHPLPRPERLRRAQARTRGAPTRVATQELRDGATRPSEGARRPRDVRRGAARLPRRGEARRPALEPRPR